ncbi:hypothetical protein MCP1_510013 [Candidatus Terasakiella magnetica]|nr:hypothetical protein MCP1_510013 [Candidatus Terasakiella magnetica]
MQERPKNQKRRSILISSIARDRGEKVMKRIILAVAMTCFASSAYSADVLWLECKGEIYRTYNADTVSFDQMRTYSIDLESKTGRFYHPDRGLEAPYDYIITNDKIRHSSDTKELKTVVDIDRKDGSLRYLYEVKYNDGTISKEMMPNDKCRKIDPLPIKKNAF